MKNLKTTALILIASFGLIVSCEKEDFESASTNESRPENNHSLSHEVPEDITFEYGVSEEEYISLLEPFKDHIVEDVTGLFVTVDPVNNTFTAGIAPLGPSGNPNPERHICSGSFYSSSSCILDYQNSLFAPGPMGEPCMYVFCMTVNYDTGDYSWHDAC